MTMPPHTTDPSVNTERRTNYVLRVTMWLLAPFVDSWTGLSLNRFVAVLFASAAVKGAHWKGTGVSWPDVALAVVAGALCFGKDVFMAYINKRNGDTR